MKMRIIGLMSGTSLDGLDIALCEIEGANCKLLRAETVPYNEVWRSRLSVIENASAFDYALANVELGHYFGRCVNDFLKKHNESADCIASHGHTVFHQPDKKLTTQIGNGNAIAAETGLPVVYDFRNLDVALGGQGAPLVPIGDELLFGEFDACLNLGGIANISYSHHLSSKDCVKRIAFDICPCNMILNYLAHKLGLAYDKDGENAMRGRVDHKLIDKLDAIDYYHQDPPKSLGKEWFVENFRLLFDICSMAAVDQLATAVEHITSEIARVVNNATFSGKGEILVTGGGALNKYLIDQLRSKADCKIIVPDAMTVNYKEAIVFAYLSYLRLTSQINTLASVTGAPIDSIGGSISGLIKPMALND